MLKFLHHAEPQAAVPLLNPRYYVLLRGQSTGPYRADELRRVPSFTLQTPSRLTPTSEWKPAFTVLDLKAYFGNDTRPNGWEQSAARALAERVKQLRREHWLAFRRRAARFLRRVVYLSLSVLLVTAAGDTLRLGMFQTNAWKERLALKAHQNLQWTIRTLQNMDSRYFPVAAPPPQVKTMPPTPPPTLVRPAASKSTPVKPRLRHRRHRRL